MIEKFADILLVGGHANSLGRTDEVIDVVRNNKARMDELFDCLFHADAWVRMRAADALEKISREYPKWLEPYINTLQSSLSKSAQASIQWHLAQIYRNVSLTKQQKHQAIQWLQNLLSTTEVDWIVAANAMETLVQFTLDGFVPQKQTTAIINVQLGHSSTSVVKKANKLLAKLNTNPAGTISA